MFFDFLSTIKCQKNYCYIIDYHDITLLANSHSDKINKSGAIFELIKEKNQLILP